MQIELKCIKGWHDEISPPRIVIQIGFDRWLINMAGRCYMNPEQEKAMNAGLLADDHLVKQ